MSLSRTVARLLKGLLSRFGLVAIRRATADEILETPMAADKLGEPAAKNTPKLVDAASPNAPS